MANFLYDICINLTYTKQIDWSAGTNFSIIGVTSGYTPSSSADQHLSDIASGDRVTGIVAVSGGFSFAARTFKFSSTILPAVTNGATITAIVLLINTGTESTSTLLGYFDTGLDLPITGTGADIAVTPDGTSGLFNT